MTYRAALFVDAPMTTCTWQFWTDANLKLRVDVAVLELASSDILTYQLDFRVNNTLLRRTK